MKGAVALLAITFSLVGALGVLLTALAADRREFCTTPCGVQQSCDAPFSGDEVCQELELGAEQLRYDSVPLFRIRWVFQDERALRFAAATHTGGGVTVHAGLVMVVKIPSDTRPCHTALRHELGHVVRLQAGIDDDPTHVLWPDWALLDGCPPR